MSLPWIRVLFLLCMCLCDLATLRRLGHSGNGLHVTVVVSLGLLLFLFFGQIEIQNNPVNGIALWMMMRE